MVRRRTVKERGLPPLVFKLDKNSAVVGLDRAWAKITPDQRVKLRQDAARFVPSTIGVAYAERIWLQALIVLGHRLGRDVARLVTEQLKDEHSMIDRQALRLRALGATRLTSSAAARALLQAADDPDVRPRTIQLEEEEEGPQ